MNDGMNGGGHGIIGIMYQYTSVNTLLEDVPDLTRGYVAAQLKRLRPTPGTPAFDQWNQTVAKAARHYHQGNPKMSVKGFVDFVEGKTPGFDWKPGQRYAK
jgi:hypothetical protein